MTEDTSYKRRAKAFRIHCSHNKDDAVIVCLRRKWDKLSYGENAGRVQILHQYDAHALGTYLLWLDRRKGNLEADKLKSQWSNLPYGSQAARVAKLQEWFALQGVSGTRRCILKRPVSAMEAASRATLLYQGRGTDGRN